MSDVVGQNDPSLRRAASVPVIRRKRRGGPKGALDDGGPGRAAALYSHFWMLRRVQRGYACFDAYARSLGVGESGSLVVPAAPPRLSRVVDGWPSPVQNTEGAWLALLMGVTAVWTLFKLDLYMKRKQRLLVQCGLWLAPMLAGLATQLFNVRTNHGEGAKGEEVVVVVVMVVCGVRACDQWVPVWLPWIVALGACACHMLWILIILFVSRPVLADLELPVSFRAAIYLDIFGWHSRHFRASVVENHQGPVAHWDTAPVPNSPRGDDQRRAFSTFTEAEQLRGGPGVGEAKGLAGRQGRCFLNSDPTLQGQLMVHACYQAARDTPLPLESSKLQTSGRLSSRRRPPAAAGWRAPAADSFPSLAMACDPVARPISARQTSPAGSSWLQSACDDGCGALVPFWVDCRSGQAPRAAAAARVVWVGGWLWVGYGWLVLLWL
eukprot:Skav205247  [mRNA]  locus=scaffold1794:444558:454711:- [translate_table: standard]